MISARQIARVGKLVSVSLAPHRRGRCPFSTCTFHTSFVQMSLMYRADNRPIGAERPSRMFPIYLLHTPLCQSETGTTPIGLSMNEQG